jgi:hypothetical protein
MPPQALDLMDVASENETKVIRCALKKIMIARPRSL